MRSTWAVLAAAALLLGVSGDLVDDVKKTIADFRALMPTGDPALGIPQLEPLTIKEIPLSVKQSPFNAKILAKNIVATGASGFEITQISQRDDGKLAVSLAIPDIEVTGEYDIDGKVKVGFISLKLSGSGPLSLSAVGIKGNGVVEVVENGNGALHVNDIQIDSWTYDKLKVQLDNLFGGGVMGKTVNTLINKIVPTFIKSNKNKINQLIQSKAKTYVNKYLDGISGNKASLYDEKVHLESEEWIISEETQEILEQVAKIVVAAQESDDSSTTSLEEQAAKILESFQGIMKDGRPDFNIPVLDPAVVNKLVIDVKHTLFNAKVIATDANIQGVSDFTVNKITQIDDTNRVTVEVEIPEVKIGSQFEIHGQLSPLPMSLNDQGPLQLNITGLKLTATVEVLKNSDESYNIRSVIMESWSFEGIQIQLDNLLGGGFWGKQANALINKIFPTLVENDRRKINARLENVVKNLFNAYLDGLAGKTYADITSKVQEISELFRLAMKSGRADFNIPVMDPAIIEELSVQVEKWPIRAKVFLNNATVSGGSDYKLTKISQIVGTNKVAVDFEVPSLLASCTYNLKSTVQAAFIKFNVNRNGPLKMSIEGISGTAIAELAIEANDQQLSLLGLEVETWSYNSIKVEVDNLSNGGFFKRMINSLINKLFPSLLVKPHIAEVSRWASAAGQRVIGQFMDAVAGRVVLPNLDARVTSLLQQLQDVLRTGNEKYDMPVYDPATVDKLAFEVEVNLVVAKPKASLVVTNITVQGTSDYTVAKISQVPNTNNIDIEIVAPSLTSHCEFEASTTVLKLKDTGSATVNIDNLSVSATASLTPNIDGSLALRGLEIRSWSLGGVTATFDNLNKLGTLGKALSKVINKVLPKIVEAEKPALTEWAQTTAKGVLDKFLAGVAAQSIMPRVIRIDSITAEAQDILKQLAVVATRAGLAA